MSLDTVVEDIRDDARTRAEEIREEAKDRAEEIREAAEAEAEELLADREAAVERQIEQEREQALSSAKLEAKQGRLEARRDVLEDVRDRTETALAELTGDRREELTRALLADAAGEFGGDIVVYGRPEDESLLRSLVDEHDDHSYGGDHDCLGGVVVESEQSRVRVNNTFDSVLADAWEDSLTELSTRLFDDE
ncbi:MAG: archaeal/vacuolar-type H+-ATPase subunit E [halophilic archaeon J07HB67]|jgi:Archaeal/vacuolar-type H+-ATPase subunit E|nr:MAG: archaeal/vacuolar-type H+-ATPase subunit E [halophilic archaeon J07HB67]